MKNRPMTNNPHVWGRLVPLYVSLALLGGCASGDKPKPVVPVTQSVLQAPGKAVLTVSDRNDGAAVLLEAAQELRVELQLSAWDVANNFDWTVAELKPGVLAPIGSRFERTGRDTNPTESDGSTIWRLRPSAPGRVSLTFGLRRPYSTGPSAKTVVFDVTVK
jgi:hypothetical protein